VIDVPFTLEPELLSMLHRNFHTRRLLLIASLKGSDANVLSIVNGKTQRPENNENTFVDNEGVHIALELSYDMLTLENVF